MVKKYLVPFLCLLLISGVGLSYLFYQERAMNKSIESPLPDFLSQKNNSEVSSLDFWIPNLFSFFSGITTDKPEISAKSALVYDLSEGKVLYDKNSKERLPMASITKLMTAIVAIDHRRADNRYTVPPEALVGENVMGLSVGEVLNLEELLYGVFMYSGNDAAETLAYNTFGREEFIKTMNKKAKAMGLKDTNFTNPTGLQGDGLQYSTAYDLLVIAHQAVSKYPAIIKAASTAEHHIPATLEHGPYDLYNQTNLITSYPGVKGLKDGYTPEAGLCLLTYLDYEGHKIVGIILGSENRRQEMKDLLDYSLKVQGIDPPKHD